MNPEQTPTTVAPPPWLPQTPPKNASVLAAPQSTAKEAILKELYKVLQEWFYKPDVQAVRIILGCVMSHYLDVGDPAWLFIVAPPGSGKSTMSLMGAAGLPEVITLSDFTENCLLSGFFGHKEPGVLEKVGPTKQEGNTYTTEGNAILLAKDFTSVLSMRREKRAAILGQLREIHDGQFKRIFGTGVSKVWKGRTTVIAAVTPVLDRHYSVFSTLGERFLQVRWHRPDSEEAGERAIQQQGKEAQIREETAAVITKLFAGPKPKVPTMTSGHEHRIACLAELIARARTHVFRRSFGDREIEYIPEAEANTRIAKGLAALARGIAALCGRESVNEQDIQDAFRVGLDCLTDYRRRILLAAITGLDRETLEIPRTMLQREQENLAALGILAPGGQPCLSENTKRLLIEAKLELPG